MHVQIECKQKKNRKKKITHIQENKNILEIIRHYRCDFIFNLTKKKKQMKYKRKKMNEKHVNKLNHLQILLKWKLEDEEKKKKS